MGVGLAQTAILMDVSSLMDIFFVGRTIAPLGGASEVMAGRRGGGSADSKG